jgi:diguanylate cyclase (GGDEF)-like protein
MHQMKDSSGKNEELLAENALLKQKIQELETSEAARKQAERRQYLAIEILGILNDPTASADSIQLILAAIKRVTGFDAVGIRLRSGDDFPYFVQNGFSHDFMLTENTLIVRDANDGPCRDNNGNISLECTCGLVISGQTDPTNPLFTETGSCWTNNSLPLLDLPGEQDPRLHPRNNCIHQGYLSVALIPIRANRDVVGLLQLNDRKKDCFTLDMIHFFEGICASVGVALLRKRAEEALRESEQRYQELSIVDDLTQLYNSRHFYHQLKMEMGRTDRYGQPLSLLLLDLDDFKQYNDAYGHLEGDQVLMRLGQVVKRSLRQTDSAYRYGGEEFTILLPMTASEAGAVIAERIRTEFKKETFSPAPSRGVHVTVSIGLAQYMPREDMKTFVHRVDQLMYQGKRTGKDRLCCES